MRRCIALAALALTGCAIGAVPDHRSDARELADALDGRTPGPPQRCIDGPTSDGPQIVGQTLLYRSAGRIWRTDPIGGCPSLDADAILVLEVQGTQLCANDRFRTLPRGGGVPGPYCRLGQFTPYAPAR